MKIYTETGDKGTTSLFGGMRVSKSEQRLEAYGTVDELNSVLGVARAGGLSSRLDEILEHLQHQMFSLGAELAAPDPAAQVMEPLGENTAKLIEQWIDEIEEQLPALKAFILPAGSPGAANLHLARCVCRRAEREIALLSESFEVRPAVLKYVNRISDLLFVMARKANQDAGVADVEWKKPDKV